MGAVVDRGKFPLEEMSRVGLQFGFGQNFGPARIFAGQFVSRSIWRGASVDRTHVGVVPLKVIGVDFDFADRTRQSELQDNPIVSGTAPAFCFPPVSHILGTTGHDEIIHRTEEHVAAGQRHSSIFDGREIDKFAGFQLAPVGDDNAS